MTVYMFPGQGSQAVGMGGTLFEQFHDIVNKADNILGYSVKQLCLVDAEKNLSKTQYTQPALYTVNALMYFQKIQQTSVKPDYVLGHSLGEYNALLAAEVFDFETGLQFVKQRGELMGEVTGGAMAAVVGLNDSQINSLLAQHHLQEIEIANYNTPSQFVISGLESEIARAQSIFSKETGCLYIPLNVSGAFHSRQMKSVQTHFENFLRDFTFSSPKIPVIANVSARPYESNDISQNLIKQLASPVRWTDSINYLLQQGENNFEEVGPGKVLSGLLRKIKSV